MTEDSVYSAKQVATRIGTDAKTLRKFFRSSASPFDAVGQGGRYEFPASQLPDIQKAFNAWTNGKTTASTPKQRKVTTPVNGKVTPKRRPKHKTDVEPGEHRGLPYKPRPTKLNASEFKAELTARGKARDEEYGTVDGEELTNEEIEALAITADEIKENLDKMNQETFEELEFDDEELELDDEDED